VVEHGGQLEQAMALFGAGDFEASEAIYRKYLASHPRDLMALNNSALAAKALGRPQVALTRLAKAVRYHPQSAQSYFNLANTLQHVGRFDEAIHAYLRAIDLRPDYVKAHLNLGNALDSLHRFAEATGCYQRALAFGGEHAETHTNLGNCFKAQNRYREALTHFICASILEPDRAAFHYDVGITRFEIRDYVEAVNSFNRVLEFEPGHSGSASLLLYIHQISCDWTETRRLAPLVRAATDKAWASGLRCSEGSLENISRDADPARNYRVTRDSAAPFIAIASAATIAKCASVQTQRRIRIGYVSADFRDHAVSHVMAGVFERHDRERFEIFAYSCGADDQSPWRRRIEAASEHFIDIIPMDDHRAVQQIRSDQIDILVDLTLWTHNGRPRLFAARPGAVQLQYLGFPGTSAAPYYDYAIVDHTVVPPQHRPFWSEALIYLPGCYFLPDASLPIANTGRRRADCGLPENAVVFCSFNQGYKIEPDAFSAWMRILAQVPNGVLWLTGGSTVRENLAKEAARSDIDPRRLVFAERIDDKSEHFERIALADVALDTLTYNGHTTTSDALWAGVPVISMPGGHFASRVGTSMLKAAGLPDLIASDIDDYVRIAVELGNSPAACTSMRSQVKSARQSPFFDTSQAVKQIEIAYDRIHQNRLRGNAPEMIVL
jgi:predicted O-linked N-acetylglucosamine transferase (SPINDLY family)